MDAVSIGEGVAMCAPAQPYIVALNGNDAWSGTLPAANSDNTDGPFATFDHARAVVQARERSEMAEALVQKFDATASGKYTVSMARLDVPICKRVCNSRGVGSLQSFAPHRVAAFTASR